MSQDCANTLESAPLPTRLLIVDDHPIVLTGLRLLFEGGDGRFAVVGEATSAAAARSSAAQLQPDAIITDLVMGRGDGLALIEELRDLLPATPILVYSSSEEHVWGPRTRRAGAQAFVSKAMPLEAVARTLDEVLATGRQVAGRSCAGPPRGRLRAPEVSDLSARELQVLHLIGHGATLQSLALELNLSVKTVGTYRERLKVKLGLDSVRMLDRYAADHVAGRLEAP